MTIDDLRLALRDGSPPEVLAAIEAAARLGPGAASLVPDLVALFSSDAFVSVEATTHWYERHLIVGREAASALLRIGIAPDLDTMRRLLADRRSLTFPAASFDHGEYVGDYGTQHVSPAGLAAGLVQLMGPGGLALMPALETNAADRAEEISAPAMRAIGYLSGLAADACGPDEP